MASDLFTLITDQCTAQPESIAVQLGQRSLTYRELALRFESICHHLQSRGVGRGDCCAVSIEHPLEAIVSFLAVLNAGAHYLPLDPSLPSERTRLLIEESSSKLLLVTAGCVTDQRAVQQLQVSVDDKLPTTSAGSQTLSCKESDPAYVIYTSGSSGRPKGVRVSRGNLTYSTLARHAYYRDPVKRFLLVSPLTFDSSVAGIYWTLTTGGTIILPEVPVNHHVAAICEMIGRQQITHLLCIPSLWNLLLDDNQRDSLRSLETVIVAGEACPRQLVARHHQLLPDTALYNEYGPTEATVWCTAHRITVDDSNHSVPIGKPIDGTKIHLLDADRRPVPPDAEGELYVAGPGVALGYVGDSELTAERFLPDPFAGGNGRMYKTGDFGRMSIDGSIKFLGRRDGQLKVRGHRIEAEEIESALTAHPGVRESAVVVTSEGSAPTRLAGFIVPANGLCPESDELKEFLAASLPSYMVPHQLLSCESIPRTKHGKVDRASLMNMALTETSQRAPRGELKGNPPANELHSILTETWQQMLDQSEIGLDDGFFDLGGDSLLALQLVAYIDRRWNARIELPQLLTHSTIRSLARLIQGEETIQPSSYLVPIQPGGSRRPLFCIHPGGGNVVCYVPLSRELGNDQPLYGIRAPGVEAEEIPLTTVQEMATEYIRLMRTVQTHGPYAIAGWSFGGIVSYEIAYQLEQAGESVCFVGVIDGSPVYSIAVLKEIFPDSGLSIAAINEAHADRHFDQFYASAADAMLVLPDADRDHTYRVLQLFASTMRAAVDYRPKSLRATMTLMIAEEKLRKTKYDPHRDWKRSCETIDVHQVPGHHLNMMKPPHVQTLAQELRHLMDRAEMDLVGSQEGSSTQRKTHPSHKSLAS